MDAAAGKMNFLENVRVHPYIWRLGYLQLEMRSGCFHYDN